MASFMGSGLDSSMWAPRPGDWTCTSCGFSNFARRKACFRCWAAKDENVVHGHSIKRSLSNPIYKSEEKENMDFTYGPNVVMDNQEQYGLGGDHVLADTTFTQKGGLATSRWAPRNYRPGRNTSGLEIWTRTVQIVDPVPQANPLLSAKPLDLGLPYEVQHFILSMIQRILEEGCYDFATRWIPHKLVEFGWSCAEAVELSTWKMELPKLLPANAIDSVHAPSLQKGLASAVRIRNAAVHRHLCDNIEIRRMAAQAEKLMHIFGDNTREGKMYQLQAILSEWDAKNMRDMDAANNNLRLALQEINEKPLNDMDWTPNVVSMEEIGPEMVSAESKLDSGMQQHGFGEAMELD